MRTATKQNESPYRDVLDEDRRNAECAHARNSNRLLDIHCNPLRPLDESRLPFQPRRSISRVPSFPTSRSLELSLGPLKIAAVLNETNLPTNLQIPLARRTDGLQLAVPSGVTRDPSNRLLYLGRQGQRYAIPSARSDEVSKAVFPPKPMVWLRISVSAFKMSI